MVTMQITRGVVTQGEPTDGKAAPVNVTDVTTQFDTPLLTLIPLNSLGVTEVDVNFDMEVKSSYSNESSQQSSSSTHEQASFDAKLGEGWWSVEVKGSVSHDSSTSSSNTASYQKSNSAKYTVAVKAGTVAIATRCDDDYPSICQ